MQLGDPVSIFTVVLLLVLIVPMVFNRLRIPGIAGLILAGMLAGPNGFGLLTRDGTFELLGKVGLLYLMFLAGLEISLREFRNNIRQTMLFGSLTFLLPQVIGSIIAYRLGLNWPAAILMASMFASHTLIPYPMIQQLGLGKHRAANVTVGGTILTDTAAMIVLAIIAESARAGDAGINWPLQILLLVLLLVFGILILPRIASWFYSAIEPDGITEFVFILSAAFLTASLAQLAGIEAIIGAFLAGLALSSLVPAQSIIMQRLHFTGNALFIPFFLLSTGMLINPRVFLSDIRTIQMCIFMASTGIITKWLAAEASGRLLGFSQAERGVMYGLSVNQAAATLAAVMVGYNLGIFDIAILNGTIAMILVTCMVGPLVTGRFAPQLAQQSGADQPDSRDDRKPGPLMVAVSNESHMYNLTDLSVLLREEEENSRMYVLNVAMELGATADAVSHSEALLGHIVARLASGGIKASPQIRVDVNPTRAILRAVRELRIETLVLGWSYGSSRHFFSESLSSQVRQASQCMTLISGIQQPVNTCKRVMLVVPPLLDRHPGIKRVMHTVARLSRQLGAPLALTGERNTLDALHKNLNKKDSPPMLPAIEHFSFRQLVKELSTKIKPDDLVIIINNRAGSLGWQPALDRLPRELRKQNRDLNMLMIFPPVFEGNISGQWQTTNDDEETHQLSEGSDLVIMEIDDCPPSPDAAVRLILETQQQVAIPALGQWVRALADMEPVELSPGVLLLHTHANETAQPRIFAAHFKNASQWPNISNPVQMLVLLVSPAGSPPEKHLETLASIVKWIQHNMAEQKTENNGVTG